ncbi:MAG: CBS domain-containing protein [Proteobacteria bacterium]|nr:CBS domain-containing protein [Pseudomonadota bacterium]MDE3207525.1 CBS domain-containing protein [Pseudomonadota bacterium]
MEQKKILIACLGTTVDQAAIMMSRRGVGAVLIVEQQELVGIFTERDLVFRVVARGLDVKTTCLADVMTHSPMTVSPDDLFGYALVLMHENGFRHLPVLENGQIVGMVSARNALDPELEEFTVESMRRRQITRRSQ